MRDQAPVARFVLRSEFAMVGVEIRGESGRERLRIEDLRTAVSVELDPLELECLAWARHADLASLLDPGLTRWQSESEPAHATEQPVAR
jgi:hypothetical protein